MRPSSLTLARFSPCTYQVTYWNDGIARWDGREGDRAGAWQASVSTEWFRRAASLAESLHKCDRAEEPDLVIMVTGSNRELCYYAKNGRESDDLWILATVLDGMAAVAQWAPFDITERLDFSPWINGVRMELSKSSCAARALARREGFIILAGSRLATSTAATLADSYKYQRNTLTADGSLELRHDCFILARHLFFRSPSAAASVVAGSNTNGRHAWLDQLGRTWADLEADFPESPSHS